MFSAVITKHLNWEVLIKNLVTFKRWEVGLRIKNLNITGVHQKIQFLGRGGVTKNQYIGGNCLKRGTWTVCRFNGGLAKIRGVVFLREG